MSNSAAVRRPWLIYGVVALAFAGAIWYYGFVSEPPRRQSS
jgi:hypothetical protein